MARREPPQHLLGQLQRLREDIQGRNRRIVGMKEARIVHKTVNPVVGDLTQTLTFGEGDWDIIKADAARIELVNNTGDSRIITDCVVRAKPVIKLSGNFGLVHDAHEDFEDIVKNGERRFEFGNDAIVTRDQLEQLADYYWKYNKTPKHVFVISLPGTCYWYQPGGWYRLDIGAAGESENIDSLCECMYVRTSRRTGENGTTMIGFREVEEAFKHDSNARARFQAGGAQVTLPEGNIMTVGSQYYTAKANSYCDGVSDEDEINNAITYMNERGGGIVKLTEGTYNIDGKIVMKSNVALQGEGSGATVIDGNLNDYSIESDGASGTELIAVQIRGLKLTRTDSNAKDVIWMEYTDDALIEDVYIGACQWGISIANCDRFRGNKITIINPAIHGLHSQAGAQPAGNNGQMTDILVDGENTAESGLIDCWFMSGTGWQFTNITIQNISSTRAGGTTIMTAEAIGQYENINIDVADYTGAGNIVAMQTTQPVIVTGLHINDVDNNTTAANMTGLDIDGSEGSYAGVKVKGCSGTGIDTDAGADRNSIGGISYGNGTNFTDNGANTNAAALISA